MVRIRLKEAHLRARCPHHGVNFIAVKIHKQLKWEKAHLQWPLARWRRVLFTDEPRFQLYWADGRQLVWCYLAKWVYYINVGNRVSIVGLCYGQVGISYGQ